MACGAQPRTGTPAATHPKVARCWDRAAGRVPAVAGHAARFASRRARVSAWVLAAGVATATAVRVPGAVGDIRAMLATLSGLPLSWLGVAVAAQVGSLASGTVAQRQLLSAGGARLPWRTVFGLVFASTGLARLMPAGPVTGGAWQVREYRRRGAGAGLGVWAVLAGGFTSISVSLALLLTGATVAGTGGLPLLACAAAVLATAAAGLTAASAPARALSLFLDRHHHRWRALAGLTAAVAAVSRQRTGVRRATAVLGCTGACLLADACLLAACFGLAGLPVPWRGLLFACAAGQLGGRLVPLPGGLGGVEGGVLGALALSGISPASAAAAVVVYRVAGYWTVGAAGTAVAAALARRPGAKPPAPSAFATTRGRGRRQPEQRLPGESGREPRRHRITRGPLPRAVTECSTPKRTFG
jgi:uncharacterized membrane protein YbhN (UPF0104 family)